MLLMKGSNLHKEWNGVPLFSGVSFEMRQGERLALIGRNGVGKTTLFQGLLGKVPFDGGELHRLLPLNEWGWLDQQAVYDPSLTMLEYVQSASGEWYRLKQEMTSLLDKMSADSRSDAIMARYGELYDQYVQLGGFDWEVDVERRLQQVGLDPAQWGLRFAELSGGQKTRASLAALMVRQPKLLLLDEPTNHLDSQALDWLEEWVRRYPGAVLYVSHDRTFIDRTATAVLELTPDGVRRYTGGYSAYKEQKDLETRTQAALAQKQEQERQKLLESIRRYAEWFQQSHRAAGQNDFYRSKAKKNVSRLHAKETALERLEASSVQKPREETKIKMALGADRHEARHLLRMEGVTFSYEKGSGLFEGLNLTVGRGDRLAVFGPNGSGKSTLLKLVTGQLVPDAGEVRMNPQTRVGYFAQELDDLQEEETIPDSLLGLPGMTQTEARTILGCFLFSRDDVFKKIGDLSMGEKCRVAFLRLYFGRGNLLVLDEPTNYLDIATRERVEEALLNYPGALLLVTHDRYLMRKAANRLLALERGRTPEWFEGTYDEYEAGRMKRGLSAEEQAAENERMELELRLAQLMSSPESEDPAEQAERMRQIIALRRRLG